ncbi:MAG: inositol monophosphatase family protein [Candidatus Njordarchaeales archaeon]
MDPEKLLDILLEILRSIDYKRILQQRGIRGYNPSGDESFLFDVIVEERIAKMLRKKQFEGEIRGEEKGNYGGDPSKGIIIIDPVDGSTNAHQGIPFYATLIAYAENDHLNDIQLGIAYAPSLRKTYWAIRGKGAYLINGENVRKLTIPREKTLPRPLIEVTSTYTLKHADKINKIGKIRHFGSIGLATCLAAEGKLAAVIDIGRRTRIPDIAAPSLIIREAGGDIVIDTKRPLEPTTRLNFIAGHKEFVGILARTLWYRRRK